MKKTTEIMALVLLTSSFIGLSASPSLGNSSSWDKVSAKQIVIDTGNGGGGAALPDVKWIFKQTPNGKPFIFWNWDPTS